MSEPETNGRRCASNWIDWLPDEIALLDDTADPIVFEHVGEPPDHVMRLMAALGVPIVSSRP